MTLLAPPVLQAKLCKREIVVVGESQRRGSRARRPDRSCKAVVLAKAHGVDRKVERFGRVNRERIWLPNGIAPGYARRLQGAHCCVDRSTHEWHAGFAAPGCQIYREEAFGVVVLQLEVHGDGGTLLLRSPARPAVRTAREAADVVAVAAPGALCRIAQSARGECGESCRHCQCDRGAHGSTVSTGVFR